jgi:hypothetical protein
VGPENMAPKDEEELREESTPEETIFDPLSNVAISIRENTR